MFVLLAAGVAGLIVGATITTAVLLLRERATEPAPYRQPMPSGAEQAQQIHTCTRCGRRIVKARESDRQHWRIGRGHVEWFHDGCWDEDAGEPRP